VPGALSNQPPVPATAPITAPPAPGTPGAAPAPRRPADGRGQRRRQGRRDATTNYELDKTIRHVRQPVGAIKRLSAAVVVNHRKDGRAGRQGRLSSR
jgi:flagellar M-ring protein FliF